MSCLGFPPPKGLKFQPSDELVLSYYLQKKNQGMDSHITAIIPEIDVSKHEPRDLPALVLTMADFFDKEWWFTMADSSDMEWHFFSPRNFKHSNCKTKSKSTKINRTTKEGSWKKQGDDRRITEACSDKQIGGKRILTFYLRGKQKTDWVIHEYYLTKADSDEQIGDFVLCILKDNSSKKKSGKSDYDRQDAPLGDGGGNQVSIELGDVVSPNGNDDAAEHGGSSCSMALNVEDSASKPLEDVLPMPYGDHDDNDHGGGSSPVASDMLTEAEENQGFEMLRVFLFGSNGNEQELGGSPTGSCSIEKSDLSASVEGQTDGYNSPDVETVEQLHHEPGDMALPHPSPSPDVLPPICTETVTNNFLNDENRKRKNPFGDTDPVLTKKNHTGEVDNNTSSNSEYQAADPNPEGYSQPGGNLGPASFGSHNLPSINREPRDLSQYNESIYWGGLPTITTIEGCKSFLGNSDIVIDGGISDINTEVAYDFCISHWGYPPM